MVKCKGIAQQQQKKAILYGRRSSNNINDHDENNQTSDLDQKQPGNNIKAITGPSGGFLFCTRIIARDGLWFTCYRKE